MRHVTKGQKEIVIGDNVIMYISKLSKPPKFRGSRNHSGQHLQERKVNLFKERLHEILSPPGQRRNRSMYVFLFSWTAR